MKEKIEKIINDSNYKRMTKEEFLLALGLGNDSLLELGKALDELVKEGVLWPIKRKYELINRLSIYKGTIQVKSQGYGFARLEGLEEDVFIPKNNINGAFNNDTVLVRVNFDTMNDMKMEGDVISIIERGKNIIIGTFKTNPQYNFIINDDPTFKINCFVKENDTLGAINDHKVKAIITEYGSDYVFCQVVKIIGYVNDPGVDILSVCDKYEIETKFPDSVYDEAMSIKDSVDPKEIEKRVDRRDKTIVTIDGEDAKDLDDAVSVTKLDNGNYLLGVYIADVSYYVTRDSEIDKNAYLRGTSVYLVDRVIPMLPERLCNGICSLNPHVDRLVIACEMEINNQGEVVNHQIFPSVIKTTERMTYTAVNAIIDGDKETIERYKNLEGFFNTMLELASILSDSRYLRGAINFDTIETKFKVDENGYPLEIYVKDRGISEGIIEEFMLMANETVAKHICEMNLPFIYRVHETPDPKKIALVLNVIKNMGYKAKFLGKDMTPRDCQKLLESLEGKPGYGGISTLLLRSMMKARYSEECLGHYGLALRYYTHFTSPIRRYPDTLVHRMLREFLFEKKLDSENIQYWMKKMPEFARWTSECEKVSVDCERDVVSMKAAEYMEKHIGEEFDGVISALTKFGMFVELANGVEGLIHISVIDNDYYEYDESRMILLGVHSHKYFQIGDKLHVRVTNASKANKQIDFKIVKSFDPHKEERTKKTASRSEKKKTFYKGKRGGRNETHRSKQKGRI